MKVVRKALKSAAQMAGCSAQRMADKKAAAMALAKVAQRESR